jgi:hypothetical protein
MTSHATTHDDQHSNSNTTETSRSLRLCSHCVCFVVTNSGKVASTTLISSTVGGLAGIYMKRQTPDVLLDASKQTWMTASATVSVQLQATAASRRTVDNVLVQVCIPVLDTCLV